MYTFILTCLVLGVAASYVATRVPANKTKVEGIGGGLLVIALTLIGLCLPFFR